MEHLGKQLPSSRYRKWAGFTSWISNTPDIISSVISWFIKVILVWNAILWREATRSSEKVEWENVFRWWECMSLFVGSVVNFGLFIFFWNYLREVIKPEREDSDHTTNKRIQVHGEGGLYGIGLKLNKHLYLERYVTKKNEQRWNVSFWGRRRTEV